MKPASRLLTLSIAACSLAATGDFTPYVGAQQNWPTASGAFVSDRYVVAILAKEDAQTAWAERELSKESIDPLRGFAFAWYKINGKEIAVYSGRNQSITSRQHWPVRTTGDRTPAEVPDGGLTRSRIEQNVIGFPITVDVGGALQHPAHR